MARTSPRPSPRPKSRLRPEAVVRQASADHAAVLARHRATMFRDMGRINAVAYETLAAASEAYFERAIPAGEYVAWVATPRDEPDTVIAGVGVQIRNLLPRPAEDGMRLLDGPEGIVLNVYTERDWRRRGVAELLMRELVSWARTQHLGRLVLHASPDGRRLYEKLGFVPTNEMRYTGGL